ncbi:MAG: hypothetical protein PF487_03270 [Bacteroidales bacterium]|jgi:hypothetical protein|nr:hypothetical protein [Bacteroidales bacterium]
MKTKGLILVLILFASQITKAQNPDISGYVRNYTGTLYDNGEFNILQNTLNLDFTKSGDKIALKANPMLYHYNADSLDLRLRELYVDLYFKNFDLRIGKQQVVWGKADGAFITDVVSPLNLSEFLLPDFNEIRRGVIATKFDYYIGNNVIELIWIPIFTSTEMPSSNSIWNIQPEFQAPTTFDWSQSVINSSLENSELFAKYSALTSNIDFEIMGGYTWDDNPAMHVEKQIDMSSGSPVLTGLNITPKHHRLYLGGGSFSTEIKSIVLRGEAAYYNGKYFQTEDPFATDALVQKNYLHYLVGVDFVVGNVNLSTQFIQEAILDYDENMQNNEKENTMTFLARYDMIRETLHFELFSYIGLTSEDALIRPKITYDFDDGFSILLGSNIFTGDRNGRFGQYKDNSMAYMKFKYSF